MVCPSCIPCEGRKEIRMEEEKRLYGLLPLMMASNHYQVGKVKFHVASHFKGKTTIEERLAYLMLEDLCGDCYEEDEENN